MSRPVIGTHTDLISPVNPRLFALGPCCFATFSAAPTATSGAAVWQTLWSAPAQTGSSPVLNSLADCDYRNWIKGAAITGSATTIRLRLRSVAKFTPCHIDAITMGSRALAGDPYDYQSTPVVITFGGAADVTIPPSSTVYSDPISLSFSPGNDYLVALFTAGTELITQ